jgi:hypothetical protein
MARRELKMSIDADLANALDGLSAASGRSKPSLVEDALRLVLDPLASLRSAAETVAVHKALLDGYDQRIAAVEDAVLFLADVHADFLRASTAAGVGGSGDQGQAPSGASQSSPPVPHI